VKSKGYPQETCDFMTNNVDDFKAKIVAYQALYGKAMAIADSEFSVEGLDESIGDLDVHVQSLAKEVDTFKKEKGNDIKKMSC